LFKAAEVLKELFSETTVPKAKDLDLLVQVLDADNSGFLTVEEFVKMGHIPEDKARILVNSADKNQSGELDINELKRYVVEKALKQDQSSPTRQLSDLARNLKSHRDEDLGAGAEPQ